MVPPQRSTIALLLLFLYAGLVSAEPILYSQPCSQGATFVRVIEWRNDAGALVDLTNYTAKLQIRQRANDADPALLTLTESSGLTLGGPAGTIAWTITAAQTATLPIGAVAYDLRVTSPGGAVTYLVYGYLSIQQRATR